MSELSAAKALDPGEVPTGPCLRTESPVLIREQSIALRLSWGIGLSGDSAAFRIPSDGPTRTSVVVSVWWTVPGVSCYSRGGGGGAVTHGEYVLQLSIILRICLHLLMNGECLLRGSV